MVSDVNILDILDIVPFPNLDDLYSRLGLSEAQVTNTRLEGRYGTAREQEKKVLLLWRNINDNAATRDVILEEMSKDSTWKAWENTLRKKWIKEDPEEDMAMLACGIKGKCLNTEYEPGDTDPWWKKMALLWWRDHFTGQLV